MGSSPILQTKWCMRGKWLTRHSVKVEIAGSLPVIHPNWWSSWDVFSTGLKPQRDRFNSVLHHKYMHSLIGVTRRIQPALRKGSNDWLLIRIQPSVQKVPKLIWWKHWTENPGSPDRNREAPQNTSDRLGVGGLSKSFTSDFDYLQTC